jgi:hypothetical protein
MTERNNPERIEDDEMIEAELSLDSEDDIPPEGKGCCTVKWGEPQ